MRSIVLIAIFLSSATIACGWQGKSPYDEIIEKSTKVIRLDPKNAIPYIHRGQAWSHKGEYNKAIQDISEAIKLDPNLATAYINRAVVLHHVGKYDKAVKDYDEAIRLRPKHAPYYSYRGNSWHRKGEYDKAIRDYRVAVLLDPRDAMSHNRLAWIMATCHDVKLRDGASAVKHATTAHDLPGWKDARIHETLAAAFAESGDFVNALKWQTKAHEMYSDKVKAKRKFVLELYKGRKPYRDPTDD